MIPSFETTKPFPSLKSAAFNSIIFWITDLFGSILGPRPPFVWYVAIIFPSWKSPLLLIVILKIGAIPLGPDKLNLPNVAKLPAL